MKKINKKRRLIIAISILLLLIILAIIITSNIISKNTNLASGDYLATTANANSNLVASYIKKGITIGGITGTLETLDTSDATATAADIELGKTAYVKGEKITGTYISAPIPDGFYYVGGTKDTGIIISDNSDDENKGVDYPVSSFKGNQFVWVPVQDTSNLFVETEEGVQLNGVSTKTKNYSNLTIKNGDPYIAGLPGNSASNIVREPDVLSNLDKNAQYYNNILGFSSTELMANSFVSEYNEMLNSIKKYNGFYIGRYELTGTVSNPTEKAGTTLIEQTWYNYYKACQEIKKNSKSVKSTMIYGIQWDATMNWLKKTAFKNNISEVEISSGSWGNFSSSPIATGSNTKYEVNGIFDLAGNYWEYTQEALESDYRVTRGGRYNDSQIVNAATARTYATPSNKSTIRTTRAVLIIY